MKSIRGEERNHPRCAELVRRVQEIASRLASGPAAATGNLACKPGHTLRGWSTLRLVTLGQSCLAQP